MKVLIVEDEKKTGEYLTKGLTEAGFVVDLADNGLNGYHLAMTGDYDLLILDVGLPDASGFEVCRALRAESNVPVILRAYSPICKTATYCLSMRFTA